MTTRSNSDDIDLYQRRPVVRFLDTVPVVMGTSSSSSNSSIDNNYEDTIDIEAPAMQQNDTLYDSSSMMAIEDVVVAASSDEDDSDNDDNIYDNKINPNDDSSHSAGPRSGNTTDDWIAYLYRLYGFFTLMMTSGVGMLTAVISYFCPSNSNQIDEEDLMAVSSLANGDKAFLFVGGDGGSSFISYVFALFQQFSQSYTTDICHTRTNMYSLHISVFLYTVRHKSIKWPLRHLKMPPRRVQRG